MQLLSRLLWLASLVLMSNPVMTADLNEQLLECGDNSLVEIANRNGYLKDSRLVTPELYYQLTECLAIQHAKKQVTQQPVDAKTLPVQDVQSAPKLARNPLVPIPMMSSTESEVVNPSQVNAFSLQDSDFDTLPDIWEVANNRDPSKADYMIATRPMLGGVDGSGSTHVCALDDDGVKCWGGKNTYGQLDVPPELLNPTFVAVGHEHSCAIDDSGVVCWGNNDSGQIDVPEGIEEPKMLSLGPEHSCVIDNAGVICWGGSSYNNEADVPDTLSNPTKVSANQNATCVIDDNGATCWGRGFQGNNALPQTLVNPSDISIGVSHGCALDDNGVHCWGKDLFGPTDVPNNLISPINIAVGYYNSCAIDDNGLQCWGTNVYGVNDIPQGLTDVVDVVVSLKHACALSSSGVTCWGKPDYAQDVLPELSFDPDGDGLDSSIDQLPLDPTEAFDFDRDGLGDNKDRVNDLFDARLFDVVSSSFNGTIANGVLQSGSRVSLTVRNTSNQTVTIKSLNFNNITTITDENLLGDNGQLSPNESFGIQIRTSSAQVFPFNWVLNFINPNTNAAQAFSVKMNLNSDYNNGILQLNAIGSTSNYFTLLQDSDNDNVFDRNDAFPVNPTESIDTDNDGLGDNYENRLGLDVNNSDSDNDGVSDFDDVFPLDDSKAIITDDDIAPVITAPIDIYVDATDILTPIDIGQALVTDNLEILVAVADNTGPYPSGETVITWQVTDSAGNEATAEQSLFIRPYVQVTQSAKVRKEQDLSFTIRLSGHAVSYPVLIPISTTSSGVNLNPSTIEIISGTEETLAVGIDDLETVEPFALQFDEPSNAFLKDISTMQVSFLEGNTIPPYEFLEQPAPVFKQLTPTAKVIVTSSQGENFFDIARYVDEVSVVGQTFLVSGSSEVDSVFVQPGVKYDLTNLKGSADKLYFSGPLSEYAASALLDTSTGTMQLSRLTDIGEEVVQFLATSTASDLLVFTDGALTAQEVKEALLDDTALTTLTLNTSIRALDEKTVTGASVKHIVLDSDGDGVMALGPNIATLISGSSGVDQIYVPAGSVMDVANLKGSQDEVYLQGNASEYASSFDNSGNIVLTREVTIDDELYNEQVTIASGGNVASNDLIIFADQQQDSATLRQGVTN